MKQAPKLGGTWVRGFDIVSHRRCLACHALKPLAAFYRTNRNQDGSTPQCRECVKAKGRAYYHATKTRPSRRLRMEANTLKKKYGISIADKERLIATGCLICGGRESLVIDHDHNSGKVRGALCRIHNSALGLFQDNFSVLQKAVQYLTEHGACGEGMLTAPVTAIELGRYVL